MILLDRRIHENDVVGRLLLLLLLLFLGIHHAVNKVAHELGKFLAGFVGGLFLIFGHGIGHDLNLFVQIGLNQKVIHAADLYGAHGGLHAVLLENRSQ